jgi:hypothetical protein
MPFLATRNNGKEIGLHKEIDFPAPEDSEAGPGGTGKDREDDLKTSNR